jgi:hypothetical protein
MRPLLQCAAALTILVGCIDTSTLPTDPPVDHSPKPSSRAEIIDTAIAGAIGDPSNSLAVWVGWDVGVTPADVCSGNIDALISPNTFAHQIFTPSGGFLEGAAGGRDVPVLVFSSGSSDFCQLVGAPLIATGTGNFHVSVLAPSSGVVVVVSTTHAIVDLVSGGQARLFATSRFRLRRDGSVLFDEVKVKLTPL